MIDNNKKQALIQDLQTIGLSLKDEIDTETSITFVFDHRGKQILIDVDLDNGEPVRFSKIVLDGKVVDLVFDCKEMTKTEFNSNFNDYISLINKEIMNLDGI